MPRPKLSVFIFMGLIASGKSTLAQAFATQHGLAYYNSDVERKELAQVQRNDRGEGEFGGGIYTPEMTRLTYACLTRKAQGQIAHNKSVVLDGSYIKLAERGLIRNAFKESDVSLVFILCEVSEQVTRQRLKIRGLDTEAVSDGTYEIFTLQKQAFEYPDELDPTGFISIETDGKIEQLLTSLASSLNIPPFSP